MAIVRITEKLLNDVRATINDMDREAAKTGYETLTPWTDASIVDDMLEVANAKWFALAPHLKNAIPKEWLSEEDSVDFNVRLSTNATLNIRLARRSYVPFYATNRYGCPDVELRTADLTPDNAAKVEQFAVARDQHNDKFKKVTAEVTAFLRASKSLNDAVKRFPNIALYVPKFYVDRMSEKAPAKLRAEKGEEVEVTVDQSLLSTVGVQHLLKQ